MPRVATRWSGRHGKAFDFGLGGGDDRALGDIPPTTWMALLLALRGTVFVYQGEELGLDEAVVPFEHMQDPFGIAHWPLVTGRDGCRTPMPWFADAPHAGFSTHAPWLPVWPAHRERAVDRQSADTTSMLATTRQLSALSSQRLTMRAARQSLDLQRRSA